MKLAAALQFRSTQALLLASALEALAQSVHGAQLPIPCAQGACGQSGPTSLVSSGTATAVQAGNALTINQTSAKAVLNWASFDVSADGKVKFVQPSTTAVALNRIFEANPSAILGSVNANGQIYLVNANGFVFGPTATVNAAGLIVSSLGISDAVFNAGLLAPQLLSTATPALASTDNRTVVLDNSGNPVLGADGQPQPVAINVQSGATLTTPSGRLLLAAPLIQNSGSLSAPDGQVVLAAGQQVFLQASADPALRGLIVEVDGNGTAWNQLTGQIGAPRGNVTMVGLAVNQDGRISATTSVSANGSVHLEAADNVAIHVGGGSAASTISAQTGGTLELGKQSSVDVLPELTSSATAVSDQAQLPSQVTLLGQAVLMQGGSIIAPGGNLSVIAAANPGSGVQTDGNAAARIRVDSGTSIDLSGSDAELPVSANLLAIQLRANELEDDPTQRNGALRGLTVYVDARVGSPLISQSALQSAIAAVPQSVAQRTENGGTATFQSEGDVVIASGATINVSGGQTTYEGGNFQTTQLVGQNGALYDIGTANPLLTYTGVVNPTLTQTYDKWGVQEIVSTPGLSHYESTYVEGTSAGTISIAAPSLVLSGTLIGQAVNGTEQRSSPVSGGTLVIGLPGGLTSVTGAATDFLAPGVEFVNQPIPVVVADDAPLPPQTVQLPVDYLSNGFTTTKIYSNGLVSLPAGVPLNLTPGGSLVVEAARIDVSSDITAPGGSLQFSNALTVDGPSPGIDRAGIQLGDGVTLDVSGLWTNDFTTRLGAAIGTQPLYKNGGSISLSPGLEGSELVIGNGVALRANGGAWLESTGSVSGGTGGSISLQSGVLDAALQIGSDVNLSAFGVDGATGGSFALTAPRILVSEQGSSWASAQRVDDLAPTGGTAPGGVFSVGTALFTSEGFSSVRLTANGAVPAAAASTDVLTVQADTAIAPVTESLQLSPGYQTEPTGATLGKFTQIASLPVGTRTPANVALNVTPQTNDPSLTDAGLLDVQKGASIVSDPGASISLNGLGGIYVDGELRAPGGTIALQVPTPSVSPDPGYLPNLRIELGPQGVLDAGGALIPTPNAQGLQLGSVLAGGTISLLAQRGSVVTDPGSAIDIDGASASLDVATGLSGGSYTRYTVPSVGGSLVVSAPESISLLGAFDAHAGVGNYGNPAAGSLEVDLTRSVNFASDPSLTYEYPTTPRVIELESSLPANAMPSDPASGLAILGVSQLAASGMDSLTLQAGDEILFATAAPLTLARQIILNAPAIGVSPGINASVTTNYAEIGNLLPQASTAIPAPGTGNLKIIAQQIDLIGSFVLQDIGTADLVSAGDIQMRSVFEGATQYGSLSLDGNLALSAARIYPATDTSFDITTVHAAADPASMADMVYLLQGAPSPGTPLSAGGSVSISADQISSWGTLLAPFGSISLNANTSLYLQAGSVTSVSGAGTTIPYGATELGGQTWIYTPASANPATITGIPARAVSLSAPSLDVASGAKVTLSGGGDLYAYEWVPGTGGSKDALGQTSAGQAVTPGLYAVLPSMLGQYASFDPEETPLSGLTAGASIYLSGGGGLAAGVYPLLPARDALIPGAYLVQVQSGYANILPGQPSSLADHTPVVAGYLTFGTTGLHSGGYEGVAIWPGSYGQSLAQYQITDASTFFAAQAVAGQPAPALPADAGSLSIAVVNSLDFEGSVVGNLPNSSGLSSQIDISAPVLTVTTANSAVPASGVAIEGSVIESWKAGELVLGGHPSADGTSIQVNADTVTVDDGAQLSADQVILVANQAIDLRPGSALLSTSALPGGQAPSALPAANTVALTGTNAAGAALLSVSDLALPTVQRSGTAAGATIDIQSTATVGSLGALSVDGPGGVNLAGNLSGSGANWSLASGTIGFVGTGSSGDSLQINAAQLSELQSAAAVRLASQGAITLYAPVLLGLSAADATPSLGALTLSATSLINQGGAGGSAFGAKTITLQGVVGAATPPRATTGGTLTFAAGELDFGAGLLAIGGFEDTVIQASSAIVGRQPGGLITGGNLSMSAPLLTAVAGGQSALSAPYGTLAFNAPVSAATAPTLANDLGGEIDLSANAISLSGALVVPAGAVNIQAAQDITVGSTAVIDAGGRTLNIAGQSVGAEGGAVTLAAGGDITLANGSSLNVSGAGDAPAGSIALTAGGAASLQATLSGAASGAEGGRFGVDAHSLTTGLAPLVASLQSGGFTAADSIRAHTGDLSLPAGSELTANQITLTADSGALDIGGTLDAPNADLRGSIGLYGATVTLDPTAQIHADTVGGAEIGGQIELGSTTGAVTLGAGSLLSALGSAADGTLIIRTPIVGNDVALTNAGANLGSLAQILVEPVITLPIGATLTAANFTSIENTVNTTLAAVAPRVTARLDPNGALPLAVRAAVDLDAGGALTLSNSLNLIGWRPGGQPVDLTFRTAGSITVGSTAASGAPVAVTISDGFTTGARTRTNPNPPLVLSPSASSSLRFVAGADAASADPLSVVAGSAAGLTFKPDTLIRTGTGDIDLIASGTVTFATPGAAGGTAPSVYTAGINPAGTSGTPIAGIPVASTSYIFNFPTQGGAIRISAGGDIVGAPVQQSVAAWQIREGNGTSIATQWGVDLDQFGWNVGSLGGGDVAINAAGSILNLSAAAADSYYDPTTTAAGIYTSSGGLSANAGGDIGSSQFFQGSGTGTLRAGGAFSAVQPVSAGSTDLVGSLIALDDAQISVEARTGIVIDALMNPTANTQVLVDPRQTVDSYFFTYGANSSLLFQTTAGDVNLQDQSSHESALMGAGANTIEIYGQIYPGTLMARSLLQDVSLAGATLFPSDDGQLQVIAGRDVIGSSKVLMSDAEAAAVATPATPAQTDSSLTAAVAVPLESDRHVDDATPALIAAGRDIDDLVLDVPKAVEVIAGRDIVDLQLRDQNLNPSDLTLVSAGRDVFDQAGSAGQLGTIQVAGPGQLDVLAGRDVNLGFSGGIQTVGNTPNPNLPTAAGANLTVMAGLGQAPDTAAFVADIITPDTVNQGLLVAYVEGLTGQSGLTYTAALTEFSSLSADQQRPLINQVFFDQLSISGIQDNTEPKLGFSTGYAAIDALFPNSRTAVATGPSPYQGDISLTFSRIYTTNGGTISLIAPGGELDVGLANAPAALASTRTPSQLGIVAQGAGDVDIYTKGDVNVNASRIFTLGGGNILIWSDEGSIDAGRGSKSSISAPPPEVLVDSAGNVTLSFSGAVAGSGIRTIQIDPSVAPGNVDLVAPEGTVNAGDAGIGAAGNINIAALHVVGLDNIQFGGNSTGVPSQVSNIGASLSGVSNTASSATNSSTSAAAAGGEKEAAAAAPLASTALSWLDVFVTGLGEENCKPDDAECLKRQKAGPR
jgi:filamentous hemagglutinin family protein